MPTDHESCYRRIEERHAVKKAASGLYEPPTCFECGRPIRDREPAHAWHEENHSRGVELVIAHDDCSAAILRGARVLLLAQRCLVVVGKAVAA